MLNPRTLVLFDFDGTLTTKDTLFLFTRYAVGSFRFFWGLILLFIPMGLQKMGFLSAHFTKEVFLTQFFKGIDANEFVSKAEQFSLGVLPEYIRPAAMQAIKRYSAEQARMVIVSASPEWWIRPWAKQQGIEVIATRLVFSEGKVTGAIDGLNCNREEKVSRIRGYLKLEEYERIIAYGDTDGDKAMLSLASEIHFKPFRDKTG
ncbi:MAG: haloacid dehalogenase-like hydrolase [Cyclobacteriaceae bacterium]|nr:haloacid dehalogenase-like hydrolase [Cyclobacteriaceae bacterium]